VGIAERSRLGRGVSFGHAPTRRLEPVLDVSCCFNLPCVVAALIIRLGEAIHKIEETFSGRSDVD
jgi:hypothetical protein